MKTSTVKGKKKVCNTCKNDYLIDINYKQPYSSYSDPETRIFIACTTCINPVNYGK